MANQLINAIRNAWSLTEYQATGGAYILLEQVERASNIDSHFLQNVVGQANGTIAFPVFDHYMMFHRDSKRRLDEVSARGGGRLLPTKSRGVDRQHSKERAGSRKVTNASIPAIAVGGRKLTRAAQLRKSGTSTRNGASGMRTIDSDHEQSDTRGTYLPHDAPNDATIMPYVASGGIRYGFRRHSHPQGSTRRP